jgi:Flp pilus assembly protein TadG
MRRMVSVIRLMRDQDGGPLIELAVMIPIMFTFLLGSVDFLNAFIQWNEAVKAVEVGARIAAVSDPVASGLYTMGNSATVSSYNSLSPMAAFTVTCDGNTQLCTCTSGTCTGMGAYSAAAMNLIVYGRDGLGACGDATSYYVSGMCDIFASITPLKVKVVYTETGLTYLPRTTPVPTITVSVENLQFQYFFLGGLMNFLNLTMPPLTTTITGEALSSAAPSN